MMKNYVLFFLLLIVTLPAMSQDMTDYYRMPERNNTSGRLLARYGGPTIRDRWYVAFDGFVRTDRAQLENSLGGLVESGLVTKAGWGAMIGWSYRERWAIEGGYARMPIHTQVTVGNSYRPTTFRYTNVGNAFMVRGKRLIASTSGRWLRSGFWLSAGMHLVPTNGQQEARLALVRYGNWGKMEVPDTLRSLTNESPQLTALAELGAEYNIRLSNAVDLGFSVRRLWGLGNAMTTDVRYVSSKGTMQQTALHGSGTGMSYGVSLRYTYALRRTRSTNVLEVKGNAPSRIR
jgi:hypothetical protein